MDSLESSFLLYVAGENADNQRVSFEVQLPMDDNELSSLFKASGIDFSQMMLWAEKSPEWLGRDIDAFDDPFALNALAKIARNLSPAEQSACGEFSSVLGADDYIGLTNSFIAAGEINELIKEGRPEEAGVELQVTCNEDVLYLGRRLNSEPVPPDPFLDRIAEGMRKPRQEVAEHDFSLKAARAARDKGQKASDRAERVVQSR